MSRRILGLDIRHDIITAVAVKNTLKSNTIETFAQVPVADEGEDSGGGMVAALETLARQMDLSAAACAVSLPASDVSFRNIRIPFKGDKKIRQVLPYEIEPLLPLSVEKLVIDFQTIGTDAAAGQTELIAAAVEKDKISNCLESLASVAVDPDTVTISGYPAALCLQRMPGSTADVILLDIGAARCTIILSAGGQVQMVRTVGLHSDPDRRAKALASELRRLLLAYTENAGTGFQPETIYLTGRGLDTVDYQTDIAKQSGCPTSPLNLAAHTDTDPAVVADDDWQPNRMEPALALALVQAEKTDGLNFRTGPFAARKQWTENKDSFIKTGILAALVVVIAFVNVAMDTYSAGKQIRQLDTQIRDTFKATFPEVDRIVDPLQQMRLKIDEIKKKQLLEGSSGSYIPRVDLLRQISLQIPAKMDVDLNRLVIGPDNVLVSGITDTFNSVDEMKNQLEQVDLFKSVTISSANIEKPGNRVRFKLKIVF